MVIMFLLDWIKHMRRDIIEFIGTAILLLIAAVYLASSGFNALIFVLLAYIFIGIMQGKRGTILSTIKEIFYCVAPCLGAIVIVFIIHAVFEDLPVETVVSQIAAGIMFLPIIFEVTYYKILYEMRDTIYRGLRLLKHRKLSPLERLLYLPSVIGCRVLSIAGIVLTIFVSRYFAVVTVIACLLWGFSQILELYCFMNSAHYHDEDENGEGSDGSFVSGQSSSKPELFIPGVENLVKKIAGRWTGKTEVFIGCQFTAKYNVSVEIALRNVITYTFDVTVKGDRIDDLKGADGYVRSKARDALYKIIEETEKELAMYKLPYAYEVHAQVGRIEKTAPPY